MPVYVYFKTAVCFAAISIAGSLASAAGDVVIHDARGHDVTISDTSRIVSVGGAVTEVLYALGLQDRIVGVDTTSLYPKQAMAEKPNVGYMRQLAAEGVLSLNPKLIIAIEGSGPRETLDVLDAAKVPLVSIPDKFSEEGLLEKIRIVAHTMGADERGACLTSAVSRDLESLKAMRGNIDKPARVMFVMSLINGRALVAGNKTAANEIIKLAGATNAIGDFDGYKPVSDEAIIAAKPDVILSMDRGKDSIDPQAVFANPAFALTPAAANKSFVAMDGLYLLGFGPRTAAAARDLAIALYPGLSGKGASWTPAALSVDCHKS